MTYNSPNIVLLLENVLETSKINDRLLEGEVWHYIWDCVKELDLFIILISLDQVVILILAWFNLNLSLKQKMGNQNNHIQHYITHQKIINKLWAPWTEVRWGSLVPAMRSCKIHNDYWNGIQNKQESNFRFHQLKN